VRETIAYASRGRTLESRLSPAVCAYRDYCAHAGSAMVPRDYVTRSGFRLGRWVERQRIAWVLGTLPPERVLELNTVGFRWSDSGDAPAPAPNRGHRDPKRMRMLAALAAYREAHGDSQVPANYLTEDGEPLGQYLYRLVKKWRAGDLPDGDQVQLKALGVSPAPRQRGPRIS
jgi:hypothetical protein